MKIDFNKHYVRILEATERRIDGIFTNQITESDFTGRKPGGNASASGRHAAGVAWFITREDIGGIYNVREGLVHPGHAAGALKTMVSLFVCRHSKFHGAGDIADRIKLLLDYLERVQRPDGTFDLLPSNFFSSPDTGFIMHNLGASWDLLDRYGEPEKIGELKKSLYRVIERSAAGMIGGGFHTPNHRWVIAAALMVACRILGAEECKNEAYAYLSEGIDIDEDGEFTERSSGIYNVVNDNALFMLSDEIGDSDLAEAARRNLQMMFAYLEPDGSIFTWNSRRQDKGEGGAGERFYPKRYYDLYAEASLRFRDPVFVWMAEMIMQSDLEAPGSLSTYLLHSDLQSLELDAEQPGLDFDRYFGGSNIARIRRGDLSITILAGSSSFLFVQIGRLRCRLKLCASFFAVAQFVPEKLERTSEGYRLRFTTVAGYQLPFDTPPDTSVWEDMDHALRRHVKKLTLEFTVDIRETGGNEPGVELSVSVDGCDRVPFKMEMIVTPDAVISGDEFSLVGRPGTAVTAGDGSAADGSSPVDEEAAGDEGGAGRYVHVRLGNDAIALGPAFAEHRYAESMRGSDPQSSGEATVYFTDVTPVERTITITRSTSKR